MQLRCTSIRQVFQYFIPIQTFGMNNASNMKASK